MVETKGKLLFCSRLGGSKGNLNKIKESGLLGSLPKGPPLGFPGPQGQIRQKNKKHNILDLLFFVLPKAGEKKIKIMVLQFLIFFRPRLGQQKTKTH